MIVPMKRLTLIASKSHEEFVMRALQSVAAVQIISTGEETSGELDETVLQQKENHVQRFFAAQALLKPHAPKSKMGPKPLSNMDTLRSELPSAMALCEEVEAVDRELGAVRSERDKRRTLMETLQPWAGLDTGIEHIGSTGTTRVITGMMRAQEIEMLSALPATVELFGGEKERAVLLVCHEADYPALLQGLRELTFTDFSFPALIGTPKENIGKAGLEIAALDEKETVLLGKLVELAKRRDVLCRACDAAVIERDREASKGALRSTDTCFILEGWVRADETEKIDAALRTVTGQFYTDYRDSTEEEATPVVLKNSKLVEPYQAVTNLYSLPAPNSIDATPLFAPFYFIFFGMMLSDTGYGIVLALGCWLFVKLMKPQGMVGQIAKVLLMGGISTVVMGLFFGSFFGLTWPEVFAGTSFANVFPLIDPGAEPMSMLAVCAVLGLVHMFFGVFIAIYLRIKQGDVLAALVDNLTWFFLVVGLLLLAAPMIGLPAAFATVGKILAIVSAAAIVLFAGRSSKSIGGRLAQGLFSIYGITSWLGDVLSYARIFALGLSTGVIGLVLNTLGGMLYSAFQNGLVMQVIGFILTAAILVALHGFMMAINCLGSFVHTARLQYVEFFGKFYEADNRPFRPLKCNTRFVRTGD